jgi:hypothetical protein
MKWTRHSSTKINAQTRAGALLGALLGASKGMAAFPQRFVDGLVDKDQIRREINTFADLAVKRSGVPRGAEEEL